MSFANFLRKGQATLEYFILFTIVILVALLSLNSFLPTVQNAMQGENGFFACAAAKIIQTPQSAPPPGGGNEYELCMQQCYLEFYDDYEKLQQCYEGCELLRS